MAWRIEYAEAASRVIRKLDRQQAKRILDYMDYRVAVPTILGSWARQWSGTAPEDGGTALATIG